MGLLCPDAVDAPAVFADLEASGTWHIGVQLTQSLRVYVGFTWDSIYRQFGSNYPLGSRYSP